jgi:hypothetical protein
MPLAADFGLGDVHPAVIAITVLIASDDEARGPAGHRVRQDRFFRPEPNREPRDGITFSRAVHYLP